MRGRHAWHAAANPPHPTPPTTRDTPTPPTETRTQPEQQSRRFLSRRDAAAVTAVRRVSTDVIRVRMTDPVRTDPFHQPAVPPPMLTPTTHVVIRGVVNAARPPLTPLPWMHRPEFHAASFLGRCWLHQRPVQSATTHGATQPGTSQQPRRGGQRTHGRSVSRRAGTDGTDTKRRSVTGRSPRFEGSANAPNGEGGRSSGRTPSRSAPRL